MRLKTVLAMTASLLAAATAHADVILVGNKSADTIWAIDLASGERQAEFATEIGPHEIEVSSDQRYAVVSNYGNRDAVGNTLSVIEWPAGREVHLDDFGEGPAAHGMAFLSGYQLAVTTEGSDSLVVVDVARGLPVACRCCSIIARSCRTSGSSATISRSTRSRLQRVSKPPNGL